MSSLERDAAWKEIWTKKGLDAGAPLHHVDGFDLLSEEEWHRMILRVTEPMGLRGNESILECGCGAGAFLASLSRAHPGLKVSGVDYSPTLLNKARQLFPGGDFFVADMTDLAFFSAGTYDHAFSFSTFHYLSSEESAGRAVLEMLRVTRPGGKIYIGEVSDSSKKEEAQAIRRFSHQGVRKVSQESPDHLYLPKSLFENLAREHRCGVEIVDHSDLGLGNYQAARYRYSVYMTKGKT